MQQLFNFARRRQWLWPLGRNGSPNGECRRVFFLLMLLVMAVTGAKADDHDLWEDYDRHCPFWLEHYGYNAIQMKYDTEKKQYYLLWQVALFDDSGDDELFSNDSKKHYGLAAYIKIGNQEEVYLGHFNCQSNDNYGDNRRLIFYENNYSNYTIWKQESGEFTHPKFPGTWKIKEWTDGSAVARAGGGEKDGIEIWWYIPYNLLNTTITIHEEGYWYKNKNWDNYYVNETRSVNTTFTFEVPTMDWNTNYTVDADGKVTVPYSFGSLTDYHETNTSSGEAINAGGSAVTEGHSHIATRINSVRSEAIGNRDLAKYESGNYTFNLSDIGMGMRSEFTIQPYVEFTHENDKDANNGTKQYQNFAVSKTFKPLPVATNLKGVFNQQGKSVTLTWTDSDAGNYSGGHWAVYRGNESIACLEQSVTTYTDMYFTNEEDVEYTVYHVLSNWTSDTKVEALKATTTVNTTRSVPVNNLKAESSDDKVTLTWTSVAYPASSNMNNKFDVYIDDKKVATITPAEGQTSFKWEHRDINGATERINYTQAQTSETGLDAYSTENLDACNLYTYRVVGQISDVELNSATQKDKAIGSGTTYENFVCSKGDNQGSVLLTWNVKRLKNQAQAETYIIERRVMTQNNDDEGWQKLTTLDSDKTFMTWEDKTTLPGVFYEYRITCYNYCENGNRPTTTTTDEASTPIKWELP